MCDPCDYEPTERLTDEFRRARKVHRCFACREDIRPGDRYHYCTEKFEGEITGCKHCLRCWEMLKAIWAQGEAAEYSLACGELWEDVMDAPPSPDVQALAFITPDEAQERFAVKR